MLGAAVFAAVFATGCGYKVTIKVNNGAVTADPDPLNITQNSGTTKVTWKFPASSPWLVQFLDDTPCGSVHILQNSGTKTCTIDVGALSKPSYKYYALSGPYISGDPQIYHMPTTGQGASTASTAPASKAPTVTCLDLTSGSPTDCKGGTTIISPVMVSPGDDIYWQPNNGWQITIDMGVCGEGGTVTKITSDDAYCSVSKTAAASSYKYTVMLNGKTYGPFLVQVM